MRDNFHRDEAESAQSSSHTHAGQAGAGASRREALIKLGRFAAYTAPVMTILLTADNSAAGIKQNCQCTAGICKAAGGSVCAAGISGKVCVTNADC